MSIAPTTSLPFPAQVELASLGDGLKRWARLKLLEEQAGSGYGGDTLDALTAAIDSAQAEAEKHAKALAAFYEKNGKAVNALVTAASEDDSTSGARSAGRGKLGELGDDPAASLAQRARNFGAAEAGDGLCDALWNLMMEAYVCCFAGVEGSCGTLWGDLHEQHCS